MSLSRVLQILHLRELRVTIELLRQLEEMSSGTDLILFPKALNVSHRENRKEEIMFRYVVWHTHGNCDLLSPSIIMHSRWATVVCGCRSVPYRVPTHLHIYLCTHVLPFLTRCTRKNDAKNDSFRIHSEWKLKFDRNIAERTTCSIKLKRLKFLSTDVLIFIRL